MALVSGQGLSSSTLNPNAPLFIPNAYRQVEDFSPQWWNLVKTSSWFRDFWLSQHPEGSFDGGDNDDDVVNFLPENFDFGVFEEEELIDLEAEVKEELIAMAEGEEGTLKAEKDSMNAIHGLKKDVKALLKDLSVPRAYRERDPKSPVSPAKYQMKTPHCVGSKGTLGRIHQPR